MKRMLAFSVILAWTAGLACGASLSLLQPNGGEELILGADYTIKWQASGTGQKIRLILIKSSGAFIGVIAGGLDAGNQAYSWKVGNFQGGTAAPGNGYKIRVKTVDDSLVDVSDHEFAIKAAAATPGLAHIQLQKPKVVGSAILTNIQVTEPAVGGKWAENGTFTIRWKTFLKKIPRIELYNYNGTEQVAMINHNVFIAKYRDDGQYEYDWRIPKGTYKWPGYYTIRVSAENGKYEGFSGKFHIDMALNMVEKNYNLEAHVDNRAHRHYSYKCSSLDTYGTGFPDGPGPGIMRVGWENSWKQWGVGNYCHRQLSFVYRSFITFDVSAFAKGKIIEKAILYITKESTHYSDGNSVSNDHPGHCAAKLFQVLAPWSSPFEVQADLIGDGTAGSFDITAIVRSWALKGDNHGLMLIGRDENSNKNNEECISYYKALLSVKTLENEG